MCNATFHIIDLLSFCVFQLQLFHGIIVCDLLICLQVGFQVQEQITKAKCLTWQSIQLKASRVAAGVQCRTRTRTVNGLMNCLLVLLLLWVWELCWTECDPVYYGEHKIKYFNFLILLLNSVVMADFGWKIWHINTILLLSGHTSPHVHLIDWESGAVCCCCSRTKAWWAVSVGVKTGNVFVLFGQRVCILLCVTRQKHYWTNVGN